MARIKDRSIDNAPGPFFVDSTCINCGSCWYIDPEHFAQNGSHSSVCKQPKGKEEIDKALLAMIDCPVAAIGAPKQITQGLCSDLFPVLITKHLEGEIYYCGWSSKWNLGPVVG